MADLEPEYAWHRSVSGKGWVREDAGSEMAARLSGRKWWEDLRKRDVGRERNPMAASRKKWRDQRKKLDGIIASTQYTKETAMNETEETRGLEPVIQTPDDVWSHSNWPLGVSFTLKECQRNAVLIKRVRAILDNRSVLGLDFQARIYAADGCISLGRFKSEDEMKTAHFEFIENNTVKGSLAPLAKALRHQTLLLDAMELKSYGTEKDGQQAEVEKEDTEGERGETADASVAQRGEDGEELPPLYVAEDKEVMDRAAQIALDFSNEIDGGYNAPLNYLFHLLPNLDKVMTIIEMAKSGPWPSQPITPAQFQAWNKSAGCPLLLHIDDPRKEVPDNRYVHGGLPVIGWYGGKWDVVDADTAKDLMPKFTFWWEVMPMDILVESMT